MNITNIIEFQVSNPLPKTNYKNLNDPMTIEGIDFGRWIEYDFPEEYSEINDKEGFIDWFKSQINGRCVINSYKEVAPLEDVFTCFKKLGYKHEGTNNCHYTSRQISLLNPKFEYYNGILHKPTNNEQYQPKTSIHSFNVYNGKVYDFSRLDIKLNVVNDSYYMPVWYFGIKIPFEVLKKKYKDYYVFDLYRNQ